MYILNLSLLIKDSYFIKPLSCTYFVISQISTLQLNFSLPLTKIKLPTPDIYSYGNAVTSILPAGLESMCFNCLQDSDFLN